MKKPPVSWNIMAGRFLFRFRSFTLLPVIGLVFLFCPPLDLGSLNPWMAITGICLALLGELCRILAVGFSHSGTSGRESYLKARKINRTGLYSMTRNPLYIGNFFITMGLLVVYSNPLALIAVALFLILQYTLIIAAEEDFLIRQHPEEYRTYQQNVPRIGLRIKNFKKPDLPFDIARVIFKENDSLFNLLMMFLVILLFRGMSFHHRVKNGWIYIVLTSVLIILYVIVKIIKKKEKTGNKGK